MLLRRFPCCISCRAEPPLSNGIPRSSLKLLMNLPVFLSVSRERVNGDRFGGTASTTGLQNRLKTVSMAILITGKGTKIELLPFWDSSIAPPFDAVAGRHRISDCGVLRPQRQRDVRRLRAVDHIGDRGDDRLAIPAPDNRPFGRAAAARDLTDGHRRAIAEATVISSIRSSSARSLGIARATTSTRSSRPRADEQCDFN
jgi:hypothetical protein